MTDENEPNTCIDCGQAVHVPAGLDFEAGDRCWGCLDTMNRRLADLLKDWQGDGRAAAAIGPDCEGDPCQCLYCRTTAALSDLEMGKGE